MFKAIKRKVGNRALVKRLRLQKCRRQFHNLNTAKSVALLYTYSEDTESVINDLIRFFMQHHMQVKTLGYVDGPSTPQAYEPDATKNLFCREQLNWYKRPVSVEVEKFINEPFDILIDFSDAETYAMRYIATLSHAAMRVGKLPYFNNPYEFLLTIPENSGDVFFVEQLKHYLHSIQIK